MTDSLLSQWTMLMHDLPIIMTDLHFLRPDWFYAFIPLLIFLLLSYRNVSNNKNWRSVIDPVLMPYVLTHSVDRRRRYPALLTLIAGSLCITALAGPVYKKLPQPVYREQSSLVILLDLSQSMNATDIKPSRLARAKLELLDLLKTRRTGQTALIVYAADAFVVTPLTDDNATIANLVPSLETDMMPAQGSNLASALSKAFALFTQAGIINGDILVVTDGIRERDRSSIEKVVSQGHRLSIFGIGTPTGGPIPLSGEGQSGFLLDSDGAIVIPKLHATALNRLASQGGGVYTSLRADDSDTHKINRLLKRAEVHESDEIADVKADRWQEEGHWLLLPLLLLAALWARRGWIAVALLLLSPTLTMLPSPAYAAEQTRTGGLENLWFNPDQQAMRAFEDGDTKSAAEKFTSPQWRASALYKSGEFDAAAKALDGIENGDALYNKGNALARQGKYKEAIKAYDHALKLDSANEDAVYNREQVKKALQQQKEQQQKGESSDEPSDGDQSQQQDQGGEQDKDSESGDTESRSDQQQGQNEQQGQQDKQQDKNDASQQDGSQQDGSQKDSAQQDAGQSDQQQDDNPDQAGSDNQKTQQEQNKQSAQQQEDALKQRDAEAEAERQKQQQEEYEKQDQRSAQAEKQQGSDSDDERNRSDEVEQRDGDEKPAEVEVNPTEASITEEQKATEQWLKRIPDDPGGLLRRKFYYQYKHVPNQSDTDKPW